MEIAFSLPIRTKSEANMREHWAVKAKRVKMQRYAASTVTRSLVPAIEAMDSKTIAVIITRVAPKELDSDNLAGSAKAIRDGIADGLLLNDGDKRFRWIYKQRKGEPKEYAVEVSIDIDISRR